MCHSPYDRDDGAPAGRAQQAGPAAPSEAELLLACRHGDAAAWEALVRRYQRLVYTVPRRAGLGEDLAAEVFQRVFLKLVEQLDRIERPDRVGAWLVTTARRETWAVLRSERRWGQHAASLDDEGEPAELSAPGSPDELVARREEQSLVRQAISGLDERSRSLLQLLFYPEEPLSYAEIAARLGLPTGSIGPTRARCLRRVRKALEGAGF